MRNSPRSVMQHVTGFLVLTGGLLAAAIVQAGSFTVNVVDGNGDPIADPNFGFRWLLQEDTTWHPLPGVAGDPDILAFNFHKSYHPLAKDFTTGAGLRGNVDGNSAGPVQNVVDGNYYVSVLPYEGYSIGGAPVKITGGGTQTVTVTVQKHPIPTAQIAIFLFHDHSPINNAPDLPVEANPPVGDPGHVDWTEFRLFLEEPAGRYGIAGGQVIQDAFGNPLGTAYDRTCDANGANPGSGSFGCFDPVTGEAIPLTDPVSGCLVKEDGSCADGTLHPNADGSLAVKNLPPGKYGIIMIPPTGSNWQQTTTIEGTKVIDAWVKAGEPPFFVEFGPPGPHVFVGFIKASADYVAGQTGGFPPLPGGVTVSGTITDLHMSRPPAFEFFSGRVFPDCWVGLNDTGPGGAAPGGVGIYAAPCNADGSFDIVGVAPGNYQLAIFDANLDALWGTLPFSVDAGGGTCNAGQSCDFGEVPVFNWFARLNTGIFNDLDQDGFWDTNEEGIGPESQNVTLRWRDGTIYLNFPTDNEGFAPFDETFPFFNWLVAEVSFANKKATGVTYVVDAGGPVLADSGWNYPSFDELTPQAQCLPVDPVNDPDGPTVGYDPVTGTCPPGSEDVNPNTGNHLSRTETGVSLTTGFQAFLGQTSVMQFGKADYLGFDFSTPMPTYVGENGGIAGIIHYATTRAEDEPQFAAAEEWEPGVPRVQVALYADGDIDSFPQGDFPTGAGDIDWNDDGVLDGDDDIIDDINGNGVVDLADVDNYPLGWADGTAARGQEDVDYNGNGVFDYGDALQVTWTDSWDDAVPTGCQGETFVAFPGTATETATDCFDGLRNFNQIRPGVFDGGYAFADYDMARLNAASPNVAAAIQAFYDRLEFGDPADPTGMPPVANFDKLQLGLIPGDYIVESATPPGYEHIKEEDRNVDFGDQFIPSPEALPVACVGDDHLVPALFSLLTKDGSGDAAQALPGVDPLDAGNAAPFAGDTRPLCDRKKVPLSSGQNAAANFFLMTDVPVVANVTGIILNDLANEFNPNAPTFGEKQAPAWSPVAFFDWNGAQVNRVNADQFGAYNAVLPSTWTTNIGMPSGMSPNMLTACMNDAGPVPDGSGGLMVDPFHDAQFSQFCYNFQYMPGTITYLDTPVLPIAAFAGPGQFPVDCERPALTPMISSVDSTGGGPFALAGQQISIYSQGLQQVPNPEWAGTDLLDKTIVRDYSFTCGTGSNAELEAADGTRTALGSISCSAATIDAVIPVGTATGDYQVVVTNENGAESPIGVTLTVGLNANQGVRPDGNTYDVHRVPGDYATIQDAINAAAAGDMVLVGPGSYAEMIIMWKPLKLQGWGAGDVFINARQAPTNKLQAWRDLATSLVNGGLITPLPGQEVGVPGFPALAEAVFPTEEGAGIFVAGVDSGAGAFAALANRNSRIDGFTVLGASTGGGIVVNGYNQTLAIGNNRITTNAGVYAGGIRIGHPNLSHQVVDPADPLGNVGDIVYDDAMNDDIRIHHNHVIKNGGLNGAAAGGIALNHGADNYLVQKNWVCGNFTQGNGAGIGHRGVSDNGLIEDNRIIFNESFNQASAQSGGGVYIGGQPALMPAVNSGLLLTPGSGNVTIDANLIRGNLAGAGDGGGIRIAGVNGLDVDQSPTDPAPWYQVNVYNNMINNNVAGLAGGGVAILNSVKVEIRNNTVANNQTVATTAEAFTVPLVPGPGIDRNRSQPVAAGIIARVHSGAMIDLMNLWVPAMTVPADWLAFSDPTLINDIVYNNLSYYWLNFDDANTPEIEVGLFPASCTDPVANPGAPGCDLNNVNLYTNDMAVLSVNDVTTDLLAPQNSLLTDLADPSVLPDATNVSGDPAFVNGYFNVGRDQTLLFPEFTVLQTAGAFDEGGNFIQVAYGPLSLLEPAAEPDPANNTTLFDYHLTVASAAINNAANVPPTGPLSVDIDKQVRPNGGLNDIGADQGGVIPLHVDTDNDGVADDADNCTEIANSDQRDSDGDGFGNICDADLDNSGTVNLTDFSMFRAVFGKPASSSTAAANADFNGDGNVNLGDFSLLRSMFGQPPGPSCADLSGGCSSSPQ